MCEFYGCVDVDVVEYVVVVDVGVDDVFDIVVFEFFVKVNYVVVGQFGLVVDGDFVVFGVEVDDDVVGKCVVGVMQKVGVFDCSGIDDDVVDIVVKVVFDCIQVVDVVVELYGNFVVNFFEDGFDGGFVFWFVGKCIIQVDQVQVVCVLFDLVVCYGGRFF